MPNQKTAIITGLRGQDGSILAEMLLDKGYKVFGTIRRNSQGMDLGCASSLEKNSNLEVIEADLKDLPSLCHLVKLAKPDYFYNTAAQSHVHTSFTNPVYTAEVTGLGVLNCLEAIRLSGYHTRFLQCSTSELWGGIPGQAPYNEDSFFYPKSPYASSKLFGHWITINYRESYKMFACCSICCNHEEPGKRGPNFVTRKITLAVANIKAGNQEKLYLGNLNARRDWSLASDFCRGMIMMLETSEPREYVLSSGEAHSVKEFCRIAFEHAGLGDYREYVEIDPRFYRPNEVEVLIGDSTKIKDELGWTLTVSFEGLVQKMVDYDLANL
jgi:GDPmannose 4,6-dehydratase